MVQNLQKGISKNHADPVSRLLFKATFIKLLILPLNFKLIFSLHIRVLHDDYIYSGNLNSEHLNSELLLVQYSDVR